MSKCSKSLGGMRHLPWGGGGMGTPATTQYVTIKWVLHKWHQPSRQYVYKLKSLFKRSCYLTCYNLTEFTEEHCHANRRIDPHLTDTAWQLTIDIAWHGEFQKLSIPRSWRPQWRRLNEEWRRLNWIEWRRSYSYLKYDTNFKLL